MSERLVVPGGLTAVADQMERFPWYDGDFQAGQPDALPSTLDAIANLNDSACTLSEYQELAKAENTRMAERFRIAAKAYEQVDHDCGTALGDPNRERAIDAIPVPAPSTPLPPIPDGPAAPKVLDGGGYSDVEQTHALLENGDKGASLATIQVNADQASTFVQTHAWAQAPTDWEGDAAQAAFTRLNSFNQWLGELASAWKRVGEAAEKIKAAHDAAYTQHMMIWVHYLQLKSQLAALMSTPHGVGNSAQVGAEMQQLYAKMAELQRDSDELRQSYATGARFDPVRVARPPFGSGGNAGAATGAGNGGAGGAGVGGAGGATAPSPASPRTSQTSPLSASGQTGGGGPAGGEPQSGGGSPSGGSGSPSGGGSPSGSPSGRPGSEPTGLPTLSDDPGLHPAAADAGGAGGGSGGGAGGGAGAQPLQPSAVGKSVGPGAAGGGVAGIAPVGAGTSGGAMGGGVGGGMGGHGQNQSGKEKRRTPGLSPDEDLYVEDREYTEEVIGARKRRTLRDEKDPS